MPPMYMYNWHVLLPKASDLSFALTLIFGGSIIAKYFVSHLVTSCGKSQRWEWEANE